MELVKNLLIIIIASFLIFEIFLRYAFKESFIDEIMYTIKAWLVEVGLYKNKKVLERMIDDSLNLAELYRGEIICCIERNNKRNRKRIRGLLKRFFAELDRHRRLRDIYKELNQK